MNHNNKSHRRRAKNRSNAIRKQNNEDNCFISIPLEIMLRIFEWLSVDDILALRVTCKQFNSITRHRSVWYDAFMRHVLSKDIPVPVPSSRVSVAYKDYTDLESFLASDIEGLTVTAIRNNRTWTQRSPSVKRHVKKSWSSEPATPFWIAPRFLQIKSSKDKNASYVDDGRFLLVGLQHDRTPSNSGAFFSYSLEVYDVISKRKTASWKGIDFNMVLDSGNGLYEWVSYTGSKQELSGDIFTIRSPRRNRISILHFSPPSARYPRSLSKLKTLDVKEEVQVLSLHSNLIALDMEARGYVLIVDWVRTTKFGSQSRPDENDVDEVSVRLQTTAQDRIHHIQFVHDWIFCFRRCTLEAYFVPPHVLRTSRCQPVEPFAIHHWGFSAGSIVVNERISWKQRYAERHCAVCHSKGERTTPEGHLITCHCRYRPLSVIACNEVRDERDDFVQKSLDYFILQPDHFQPPNSSKQHAPKIPYSWPMMSHQSLIPDDHLMSMNLGVYGSLIWKNNRLHIDGQGSEYGRSNLSVCGVQLDNPDEQLGATKPRVLRMKHQCKHRKINGDENSALCERAGRIALIYESRVHIWDFV